MVVQAANPSGRRSPNEVTRKLSHLRESYYALRLALRETERERKIKRVHLMYSVSLIFFVSSSISHSHLGIFLENDSRSWICSMLCSANCV